VQTDSDMGSELLRCAFIVCILFTCSRLFIDLFPEMEADAWNDWQRVQQRGGCAEKLRYMMRFDRRQLLIKAQDKLESKTSAKDLGVPHARVIFRCGWHFNDCIGHAGDRNKNTLLGVLLTTSCSTVVIKTNVGGGGGSCVKVIKNVTEGLQKQGKKQQYRRLTEIRRWAKQTIQNVCSKVKLARSQKFIASPKNMTVSSDMKLEPMFGIDSIEQVRVAQWAEFQVTECVLFIYELPGSSTSWS